MSIEDDIVFLEGVPIFALLGRPALRILAIGSESRYVHGGEVLFKAGDPADCGYLIQEGSFTIEPANSDSSAQEMTVGRGALLGEIALLIDTVRPVTATATEPSTAMRISRNLFLKMLEGFPEAAHRLRDHIAGRADQTTKEMSKLRAVLDPSSDQH
jgi:CRP-like cAMP-binding protein